MELLELENITFYYLLDGEQYAETFGQSFSSYAVGMYEEGACGGTLRLAQVCELANYLRAVRTVIMKWTPLAQKASRGLFFLKNSDVAVEWILAIASQTGKEAAFLTLDHEFRHNWKVFTEVMKRRPDLKTANNFLTDDNFGAQEFCYLF